MLELKSKSVNALHKAQDFLAKELLDLENLIKSCFITTSDCLINQIASHLLFNSKGKMIRPILTMLFSKMLGYQGNSHISLAGAIELIHVATLLHDDVIDESQIRRSALTAQMIWGNKASILGGDFFFTQAFKLMVKADSLSSLDLLASTTSSMVKGEIEQLVNLQNMSLISKDEYLKIIEYKTGKLFAASCSVAFLITFSDKKCDKNRQMLAVVEKFGLLYGLIYQIQDDTADYFNVSTGKQRGKDFTEGKATLPLIILCEKADKKDLDLIKKTFRIKKRKQDDFDMILYMMDKYAVRKDLNSHVFELSKQAQYLLSSLDFKNYSQELLFDLVKFISV